MTKIAVLGSGEVGESLANGFLKHGYAVTRGSREPAKLAAWKAQAGDAAAIGTFTDAARWGDIVVLAVKGAAAESALELAGVENLAGKLVLDTTNPIADQMPEQGVLHFFTDLEQSPRLSCRSSAGTWRTWEVQRGREPSSLCACSGVSRVCAAAAGAMPSSC